MRADRLLTLLLLLQSRGSLTAHQLADELEVSERTIYRDVNALSVAGVPVYAERGPGGGVRLLDNYRTTLTGLNTEELRALLMLNIPSALEQLGVGQELRAALLKLIAALPAPRREEELKTRQRIYLDWSSWQRTDTPLVFLPLIQTAVWQDCRVWLRYRAAFAFWVEPLELSAAAYGLAAKEGHWFLVAERGNVFHVIDVEQVLEARLLDEHFTRAETFDLQSFWQSWCARRQATHPSFLAVVRVRADLRPVLPVLFSASPQELSSPDVDGWQEYSFVFETFDQARQRLLACGGSVEVLEPLSLRLSVADFARQTAARYPSC